MAPPRQVAAPPKGSISVGWLWVSFLNITSQSSSLPSILALTLMLQALISSDSSRSSALPCFLRYFAPMQAISMRHRFLSLFSVHVFSHCHVFCKGFADDLPVRGVVEADVFEGRIKRCMSAVIGPVCIDDFQFCQGRVAVLRHFHSTPERI